MKGAGKHVLIFSTAIIVLILDQLTKFLVFNYLKISKPIIKNVFHLTLSKNYGAGFSILQNQRIFFILFTLVVVGVIFYYYKKIPNIKYVQLSIALILGGAIGNLIDRITLGYVIDFIDFQVWPIFNIADTAITLGAIGLIYYFWKN